MVDPKIPDKQRVLILQGGDALGAYEVGAFKALSEEIPKIDAKNSEPDRPLFDIVAGTSIGAINAAILVSYVKENNGSWKGASEKLEEFWKTQLSLNPDYKSLWSTWQTYKDNPSAASEESARRYYSAKYFLQEGASKVFSKPSKVPDAKFFDDVDCFFSFSCYPNIPNNSWYRYSNERLRESISNQGFAKFPISTDIGEPLLLIVSTDIEDGAAVTFDSYIKQSEYGRYDKRSGKSTSCMIRYDKGIEPSHVMTSACIPLFYNYEEIQGRKFWDGGILSNTPFREVLQQHRDFWSKNIGGGKSESKVPDLEVYIISVGLLLAVATTMMIKVKRLFPPIMTD